MTDGKEDGGAGKTLSAAARRSFFRRRLKHKRSGSKDGKDPLDSISMDALPLTEGEKSFFIEKNVSQIHYLELMDDNRLKGLLCSFGAHRKR